MNGRWMNRFVPTALLALALVACGGGTSPTPSVTGVSVTLATSEIAVDGSTTASASVQGSVGVSQAVTWSSSDASVATVASSGLVTGVSGGVADIIATSTVDVTKSGSAPITVVDDGGTVDCSTTTPLSGNIVSDTTLALDCYSVTGVVNIQDGATLTIPAGAVLRFANTAGLRVQVDGALVASGTAVNPILLTSTSSIAGSWLGVYVRSNDPTNVIRHVTVAYAGQENFSFHGANNIGGGVRIADGARAAISNSTFRGNNATGVRLDGGATVTGFADNAFDGNAGTAMLVSSNQLGMLDAESDYAGAGVGLTPNTDNHIGVRNSTVSTAQSWPAANAPYRLAGFTNVDGANAAVTVAPGAIFEGTNGSGIRVRNDASFNATGTPSNGILFRGVSVVAGTWLGLYFESNSPSNVLDHVTVAAAGGFNFSFHGANTIGGGVRIANGARASISNSTFRENQMTGVYLDGGATVTNFADNAFDGNAGTAMLVSSNQLGMLDADSDYAGAGDGLSANTDNHIGVRSSTVTTAQSWPAANAPYRLSGFTNIDGANAAVTVAPGAIFEGTNGSGIRVRDSASLKAVGTASARIIFHGVSVVPGTWIGIYIQSNSADNVFEHVTVDAAGNPNFSFHGANVIGANIRLGVGARLALSNSTLSNSQTAGLRLQSGSILVPEDPTSLAAGNEFAGNATDVVDFR